MFFARKRSANAACAKAKRQHDVGHSVVATGRSVLRLSSYILAGIWAPAEK